MLNLPCEMHGYTFTEEIGAGGFSRIYLVSSNQFQNAQFVAKVVLLTKESRDLSRELVFRREVNTLAELNHPNIIRLYDSFSENNYFVMILEYCPNGSLADEVKRSNGLSNEQFTNYARQIVSAIQYCHSKGISHHDIKMQNILIDNYGRPKLADFGLSIKLQDEDSEIESEFLGSLSYVAPEIFLKKPYSPIRADIWALGVLFVYMATGKSPWMGATSADKIKSIACVGSFQLKKTVSQQISNLIRKMIVVDPKKRITAEQLANSSLFKVDLGMSLASPRSTEFDALSPRGRKALMMSSDNFSSSEFHTAKGQLPKSLEIYRTNIISGFSTFKKIKPRMCNLTFYC